MKVMNKMKYFLVFFGISVLLNACVKPDDPTEVQILTGEWMVKNVIANGQINIPDDVFMVNSVLHLDRNETFLFINVDGRANAGTWAATDTRLTLTGNQGNIAFNIVYLKYDKLHVYYTFGNQLTGEIELRYLFERIN
jgi:hypothetical protein